MKKEKYIELCKKEFNLTQKEAERVVNYLEALMVNVIKEEIKMYVERN